MSEYFDKYSEFYKNIIQCKVKCAKRNSDSIPRPSWIGRDYAKHPSRIFHVGMNPISNECDDYNSKENYLEFRERYLGDELNDENIQNPKKYHPMYKFYQYISKNLIKEKNPLNYTIMGNIVKCQSARSTRTNTHPTVDMINNCVGFLENELELLKPNVVIVYTKMYGPYLWNHFECKYKLDIVKDNLAIVTLNSNKFIFAITGHPAERFKEDTTKYRDYEKLAKNISEHLKDI